MGKGRVVPAALSALCFLLAFIQRPGLAWGDTRIELSADPALFLQRVGSVWSTTTDLGHVQASQFVGYLFPMGPFFALTDALGVPMWIAQRIWLGALLSLAAWGVVRLMDHLYSGRRGPAHVIAALIFAANPYVVVFVSRGTVTLLAYAALPWLLVAVHRGLAEPRRWRFPVLIAVLIAAAGGGVNAAVVFWVALAPVLYLAYEVFVLGRPGRDVLALGWRAGLCAALGSAWWILPLLAAAPYGVDFLRFTEQPTAIFATPSMSESLRLLGYWIVYLGIGFGRDEAIVPAASHYLQAGPILAGSFLVPALAVGGLLAARRWIFAPFFGLLAAGVLIAMSFGFPPGTLAHDAVESVYYNAGPLQSLRTLYKAAPLLALCLACLGGVGATALVARAREGGLKLLGTRVPAWALAGLVPLVLLWAAPLVAGRAIDPRLAYGSIPDSWRDAMRDVDRTTPADRRAMVLPGTLFGWYRWGGTYSPVAPALAHRPVVVRDINRYADPRASQLVTVVDDLVQQGRLVPGQLAGLLRVMGVQQVVVATDGVRRRTGEVDPARLDAVLAEQDGFERPARAFGATRTFAPERGRGGEPVRLPELRRYALPGAPATSAVRVHPVARTTVLEGDAHGVAALAAHGGLDPAYALLYAGDVERPALSDLVRQGATLVFSDTNRRRYLLASRMRENIGPTLGPGEPIERYWATYDLFDDDDPASQTVARYTGLRLLRSPRSSGFPLFPQYRAYAAFDGRLSTAWVAQNHSGDRRQIEVLLERARSIPVLLVHPHADGFGRTSGLAVSVNGGPERSFRLRRGWNRLRLNAPRVASLRLRVTAVHGGFFPGQGGLDEVRIPGLEVRESLRMPISLAARASGLDLSRSDIAVVLERTTADHPTRAGAHAVEAQSTDPLDMVDPEPGIEREVSLPAARTFALDGWATTDPAASDAGIDRLTGLPAGWAFTSSDRFEGVPARRASSAFDGDPATAWIAERRRRLPAWVAWRAPERLTVSGFRLQPGPPGYAFPTRVQVSTDAGVAPILAVRPTGEVRLPVPITTDRMRIDVVSAARRRGPGGDDGRAGARRLEAVAVSEIEVPRLRPPALRRAGPFATVCGALVVRGPGGRATAAVAGRIEDLDAGVPLRLRSCGAAGRLALPAGSSHVSTPPGPLLRADHLRLRSPAPRPGPAPAPARVLDPGRGETGGAREGARIEPGGPAWVVLGEGYSAGWRATCRTEDGDERGLGEPVPIDGFANGWRAGADCREVSFSYAPQRLATASYAISGLSALAALLVAMVALARRMRARLQPLPATAPVRGASGALLAHAPPDPLRHARWLPALGIAAAIGLAGGLLFAWRAGAALAIVALILLREGVNAGRLLLLALAGMLAIPVLYLIDPVQAPGGFAFSFAQDHILAHWVAVVAVCCLGAGAALRARAVGARVSRATRPTPAPAPADAGEGSAPP